MDNQKQWWAPILKGLVVDSEAKHYKKMGNAVWLFLYLFLNADQRSGFLAVKVKTISSGTGIKPDTILRWLNILRKQGYIATQNTGRGLLIQIREWKEPSPDIGKNAFQKQQISNSCGWENPITDKAFNRPNELISNKKPDSSPSPIDTINKYILKNDIDSKDSAESFLGVSKEFKSKELAVDIARALEDQENLALYISYCRRYPLPLLRTVLAEVRQIPSGKIKKSRGALFNYLVQKYAKENHQNPGH